MQTTDPLNTLDGPLRNVPQHLARVLSGSQSDDSLED